MVTPLSTDEAVEAILTGDHPQGDLGSVTMDSDLIDMLRGGYIEAGRDDAGVLVFRPTPLGEAIACQSDS